MPHQRNPVGITAELGDMLVCPCDRGRTVLDEVGPMRLGRQPIIGNHDDEALPRQRAPGKAVTAPLAAVPATAIEEYDDRQPVTLFEVIGCPGRSGNH